MPFRLRLCRFALGLLTCSVSACLGSCGRGATSPIPDVSRAPLKANVPCGLPQALLDRGFPRALHPTQNQRPDPFVPGTLTVAVLPDTQYYALCRYPHLHTQTSWLEQSNQQLNLKAVLHLGDLTESNTPDEWSFVRDAIEPLWSTTPTLLATGNHDYGDDGTANRRFTHFQAHFSFPPPATATVLAASLKPADLENAYYRIPLPQAMLGVLVLEWSPGEDAVRWANDVLSTYDSDRVIFVNHTYLYHDSTRYDWVRKGPAQEWSPFAYGTAKPDTYDGERLWRELISLHSHVFLTLNGHVLGDGAGYLGSLGAAGNVVHQVLVNYQMLDEGGLGYLRLLEFDPDGTTLRMRSYSPSLGAWATAPEQHFDLVLSPPLW